MQKKILFPMLGLLLLSLSPIPMHGSFAGVNPAPNAIPPTELNEDFLPTSAIQQDSFGPQSAIPKDPAVRMGQLDNGLRYFIRKNNKPENRAELRLAVNAGSINEDNDQQGLAHFVEHMAFNGTENFEKSELVDYLESIGTKFGPDLNAYTSFDETVYMLQVRTDESDILEKGLTVLEDWAGGVTFNHEEIDKERGVVLSEWRSGLSPDQRMRNQYFPIMYQNSKYANRLPIGKPEIIENADYNTVKRFYNDWYRPNLMAIAVVGDVDVDEMEKEIRERFSDLKNPATPRKRTTFEVPSHEETLVAIASDEEAPFTDVRLMYKHPTQKVKTMQDYRQQLVYRLYNSMINARLDELRQQAAPPFLFAYTGYSKDLGDKDTYTSFARVAEGQALQGLKALLVENKRVLQHGFTAPELDRQKTEMLTSMEKAFNERDKTDSRRYVMRYVYHFLDEIPMPSIENEYQWYQMLLPSISLEEVNALAEKWITNENRVLVITGPEKEEATLPQEEEVRNLLKEVDNMSPEPYEEEVSDEPLLAKSDWKEVQPSKQEEIQEIDVTRITYPNGVELVLKSTDFKNDEILVRARSAGGHSLYPDEDYFAAATSAEIISNCGLGNFNMIDLQKKLAGKNVEISPYVGSTSEGFRGSTTPKDLETLLQIVYLGFTQPRQDEEAFSSYVTRQKNIYQNLMSNPLYYFYDKSSRIKYGNHPRTGFPTSEDFENLGMEQSFQMYKDRFSNAGDFTFYMVGNFDKEEIMPLLNKYFGNLPGNPDKKEQWKDIDMDLVEGKVMEDFKRGQAPRANVDITFHGDFTWNGQNRYDLQSMLDVMRIKLREAMREDKGGVYGVRVSGGASQYPDPTYSINISFNADPPMVEELIQTAMAEIEKVKKNGAEDKDLTKVKETQRQERIKELKENDFWIGALENADWNQTDPRKVQLEHLEKMIEGLNSKDVQRAARKYFNMDNYIQIVMRPETE